MQLQRTRTDIYQGYYMTKKVVPYNKWESINAKYSWRMSFIWMLLFSWSSTIFLCNVSRSLLWSPLLGWRHLVLTRMMGLIWPRPMPMQQKNLLLLPKMWRTCQPRWTWPRLSLLGESATKHIMGLGGVFLSMLSIFPRSGSSNHVLSFAGPFLEVA